MNLFGKNNKSIEPLEIKHKILDEIDDEIVSIGGGQRKFPHAGIEIHLFAPDDAATGKYQVAFVENNLLEKAIYEFLQPPRCAEAKPFVKIIFENERQDINPKRGFKIALVGENMPGAATPPEAYLEVLEGSANVKRLRIAHPTTYIGRCEETKQKDGKVVRKNDLFFLDQRQTTNSTPNEPKENDKINASVSRLHAHIEFDEKSRNYYLFDDGSRKGTTILRGGRGIGENIDRNAGKILNSGDVINFGKAQVKFRLLRKE